MATLEALLNTDQYRRRRQFSERCQGLASEPSLDAITNDVANRVYTAHSQTVHGSLNGQDHEQLLADLATIQLLARTALRRCIEDAVFRAIFDSRETVAAKWPVSIS